MKVSLDENRFWMKVSVDEIDFLMKVHSTAHARAATDSDPRRHHSECGRHWRIRSRPESYAGTLATMPRARDILPFVCLSYANPSL